MGEAVVDLSSPKETARRIGTATTTRSSASVVLIDDGTLDTIFCPADGLSIASTLDDVFCSAPTDESVIDSSPNQRRRKQIAEVSKQNSRHSPEKKEKNRVASPRTSRGPPGKDLSKHRKSEVKSSPRYPSASKSRKEDDKDANLDQKGNEDENLVKRRRTPPRTVSKSRIETDEIHVEGSKRMSKRRNSNSQVEGVKQTSRSAALLDNSKRTRSSSHKSAIKNLEMRVERSISSHRRGNSEPRILDLKQQKTTGDNNSEDRASRIASLERTIDSSKSANSRRSLALLFEKSNQEGKSNTPNTPRRSQLVPQRSISTSRLESRDRQERRSLNKRSSSDSRIVQADQDHGTHEIKSSVRKRTSPPRHYSKTRIENLEMQIERSRSSHKRRNSNPRPDNAKDQRNEGDTEHSNREPRSLQSASSKSKIDFEEKRGEHSRSPHRRGNSKSGMKDTKTQKKNDDIEKSERTRSSHQTHSSHKRPSSKTRVELSRKIENKEKVGSYERRGNSQNERGKLSLVKGEQRRRSSKSRVDLPIEAEHGDSSERTRSSHNRGGSVSKSQQFWQQESKLTSEPCDDTQRTPKISHLQTSNVTESDFQLKSLPVSFGVDGKSPKTEPTDDRKTEKGYLIRPFWRKSSNGVNSSPARIRSPMPRRDQRFEPDVSLRNTPRIMHHSSKNNDIDQDLVGKSPTKPKISRPLLQSNFQPHTGKGHFTDIAPLRAPEDGVMNFREHFPTALTASEDAIIPRIEEKTALLQPTEAVENGSPRERIKSLSPTKFLKKASQRFSNAVAQLSERVLPVGASNVPSREQKYAEPMPTQKTKTSIRKIATKDSAVRADHSDGDPRPSLRRDAPKKISTSPTISETASKYVERSPSPSDRKNSRPRPRSKSVSGLESEKSRTMSPSRNIQRQNSRRAMALKIRSSSLRHLGSPSSPGKLSGAVSPLGRLELGSQHTSVATPSTKYSSDSSTRPAASSPRHRRRHASSLAARHSLGVFPIENADHVHRMVAGTTVNVLLSEALLPPAIASWSSSLLFQVYIQDENQWVCFGERNLHNTFTETLFCFELGCKQAVKLSNSFIEVRIYDGFDFRGCLHLPTGTSYEATWFDVLPNSLNKECAYPHAKGQIQVTMDFVEQTMPLVEAGFVLKLPQQLEVYLESGEIHCVAIGRDRGIMSRDGSCVYQDMASQNKVLQRKKSGLHLALPMVPMSVGAMFLIATDSAGNAEQCLIRRPENQMGICSIKMHARKTTILAKISRNLSRGWEMTGICQSFSEVPNLGLLLPVFQSLCSDMLTPDCVTCDREAWVRAGESVRLQDYCSETNSLRVEIHFEGQVIAILSDNNGRKVDFVGASQPQSRDGKSVSLHPNVRNAFSLDLHSLSSQVHTVGFVAHATNVPMSSSLLNFRFVVRNRQTIAVQYLSQEQHVAQDTPASKTMTEGDSFWLGCFYRDASNPEWNFLALGTRTHIGQTISALALDLHKMTPHSDSPPVALSLEAKPLGDLVYLD